VIDLPDTARWVEAHGIADDPDHVELIHDGIHLAVVSGAGRLAVVTNSEAELSLVAFSLKDRFESCAILVERELAARVIAAELGRRVERAVLHTLPEPDALIPIDGAVPLPADAPLDHLRPEVADEIRAARGRHAMWACYVDGLPVAFAYAPWRSAKYFDISVDVDPSARQLGLGVIVATTLIHAEREHGREPVWGADENNVASQRLAHRLGFVAVDELWVLPPVAP
jgi:GNAT superfamily N-acetyltransferase